MFKENLTREVKQKYTKHIFFSVYSGDLKSDSLKSGLFEGCISNGWVLAMAIAPTIRKPDHLKSRHFCKDFKWFLTKWPLFVRILKGWVSGFQILFKIQTICNPTSFGPFEIPTVLLFISLQTHFKICEKNISSSNESRSNRQAYGDDPNSRSFCSMSFFQSWL